MSERITEKYYRSGTTKARIALAITERGINGVEANFVREEEKRLVHVRATKKGENLLETISYIVTTQTTTANLVRTLQNSIKCFSPTSTDIPTENHSELPSIADIEDAIDAVLYPDKSSLR